jgi:rhodanese-related sulfurtransferase
MERTITPTDLQSLLAAGKPITLLDVRRAEARAKEQVAIQGAIWRDPAALDDWIADLDCGRQIILYCVHGEEISNAVVDALQAKNLKARFVEGGLDAWQTVGGPIETFD